MDLIFYSASSTTVHFCIQFFLAWLSLVGTHYSWLGLRNAPKTSVLLSGFQVYNVQLLVFWNMRSLHPGWQDEHAIRYLNVVFGIWMSCYQGDEPIWKSFSRTHPYYRIYRNEQGKFGKCLGPRNLTWTLEMMCSRGPPFSGAKCQFSQVYLSVWNNRFYNPINNSTARWRIYHV